MHCVCCDKLLSEREATRKFKESREYTDTCDDCLKFINLPTITRNDLSNERFTENDESTYLPEYGYDDGYEEDDREY